MDTKSADYTRHIANQLLFLKVEIEKMRHAGTTGPSGFSAASLQREKRDEILAALKDVNAFTALIGSLMEYDMALEDGDVAKALQIAMPGATVIRFG